MNLSVKFWKDEANNPLAYPGAWPCECIQEGDPLYRSALDSGVYQLMSEADYLAYRQANASLYDVWLAAQPQGVA